MLSTETRIKRLRTPWARRIVEVLADGDWHPIYDVIAAAAEVVPPGVAFRYQESNRNLPGKRPNGPGARVRGDDATSIDVGARAVARRALRELSRGTHERSSLVERSTAGYMVRLRPS